MPPPPLHLCLLVRYSAHAMSCDITLLNHISCIIEHLIWDLAEEPPPRQPNRERFWEWIYPFHAISSNFGSAGRKVPTSFFCLFVRDLAHITHVEYHDPHTTNPHSDSSYLNIFFRLPTCHLFKILTYRDVQDTVSWCRWKAYRQPKHNPH